MDRMIDRFTPAEVSKEERVKVPEVKRLLEKTLSDLENRNREKNREKEIVYSGFEKDPDFKNIKGLIEKVFGRDEVKKLLISEIAYFQNASYVFKEGENYYLPTSEYKQDLEKDPALKFKNRRAENFCINNFKEEYADLPPAPMPIALFSFYSKDLEGFKYLQDIAAEDKMKVYKIGLAMHEVAHSAYYYLLNEQEKKSWTDLIKGRKTGLTEYSNKYYTDTADKNIRDMEEFAEAVRLYSTRHDFLKSNAPEVYEFIAKLNIGQVEDEDLQTSYGGAR